jgi:two-component system, OmpR family, response regulator
MIMTKRILLVDDDPSFTRTVKVLLETSGNYSVEEENNSRNAFATARWFRPDLIFLDVMMPDLDGGDIAHQIESDALLQGTPIVFFTGLVSKEEAASNRIGGYRFIAKPIRRDQLLGCVDEILKTDHPSSNESAMNTTLSTVARLIQPFKRHT